MFNDSKYTKWYFNIIESAKLKNRKKSPEFYYESHHIIPLSLGGLNQKQNKIFLTFKEHYVCHELLIKMVKSTENKVKMNYALYMFNRSCNNKFRSLTKYKQLKSLEANRKACVSRQHKPFKGKKHTLETLEKMRIASTGVIKSTETIKKIKNNNIITNESRSKKVQQFQIGKEKSEIHKNNLSNALKTYWSKKKMVSGERIELPTSSV